MDSEMIIVIGLIIFIGAVVLDLYLKDSKEEELEYKQKEIENKCKSLANNESILTPDEFFEIVNTSFGGSGNPRYANKFNFPGVYVLHNVTQDLYYIGQGGRVFDRVKAHLSGKGNGDVYADYKYGDEFTIQMISLANSEYTSLNELERNFIQTYDAVNKGYNKTKGNRN